MTRRKVLNRVTILTCLVLAPTLALAAERWSGDGIPWEVPEGWSQKQGSSEFRFAQVDLGAGLVMVVSRFPGDVGGTLANVNRWRGQLMLPPIQADELEKATKKVQAGDAVALLTDFTSPDGSQRMLGAILPDEKASRTWFFKVTGPAKAVGERGEKFQKFIESVKLEGAK